VPPGLTSHVQPLDVSFNKVFKSRIIELQEQLQQELGIENQLDFLDWTPLQRRVFMTRVISLAFSQLHNGSVIPRSFKCTGINLQPNGSDNHEISVKGFEATDLDIANWRDIPLNVLESQLKVKEEGEGEGDEEESVKLKARFNRDDPDRFARALMRQNLDWIRKYDQALNITILTGTKQLLTERIINFLCTMPGSSQSNPVNVDEATEEYSELQRAFILPIAFLNEPEG
jgi:hypothetical protein